MKKQLLFILIGFISSLSFGQHVFQKRYHLFTNDYLNCLIRDDNEGLVATGSTGNDVFLQKFDFDGNLGLSRKYQKLSTENANVVLGSVSGGYLMAGDIYETQDYDGLLIMADSNGGFVWGKSYGGNEGETFVDAIMDFDENYVAIGSTQSFEFVGKGAVYMVKLNELGDTLWTRVYGLEYDQGLSICQTSDSNYVIAGHTSSFSSEYDLFLMKMNKNGDVIWHKSYLREFKHDELTSVLPTSDGGFLLTGLSTAKGKGAKSKFGELTILIKTDSLGEIQWSKEISIWNYQSLKDVIELTNGGFAMVGEITMSPIFGEYDIYALKVDNAGNFVSGMFYGFDEFDYVRSIVEGEEDALFIGGICSSSKSTPIYFGADLYLIKTDENGFSGCNEEQFVAELYDTDVEISNNQILTGFTQTSIQNINFSESGGFTEYTICDGQLSLLEEDLEEKVMIKTVDLLGRETTPQPNEVYIQIFEDGTIKLMLNVE